MKLFKKYTSTELFDKFKACCARFPLSLFFFLCLTVTSIILVHHYKGHDDQLLFFLLYYPATAAILSLSLHLWCEEMIGKLRKWMIQIAVHVVWLLSAIYLTSLFPFGINHGIACISAVLLVLISIFLLSFYKQKNDIEIWNFTLHIITTFIITVLVCILLAGGISLLLLSFEQLFGLHISGNIYIDEWVICMLLLAPILFLSLIPQGEAKHDKNAVRLSRFGSGVIHYLFIPLLSSYLIVLYLYALKIIFSWTLPCGWVSWLVAVLMLGMVLIIALLYPTQFNGEKKFDKFLMRYLPLMVMPLLLLMTTGIIRRVSDYGITIWRLYLIAFNVWCYIVCIILFINHSKRIWWIPASFSVIFFLLSVGPQSMANITRHTLLKEVTKLMDRSGIKHRPMNQVEYQQCVNKLDTLSARQMDDKLKYLNVTYDKATVTLIDSSVETGNIAERRKGDVYYYSSDEMLFAEPMEIPAGYHKIIYVDTDFSASKEEIEKGIIPLFVPYKINGKEKTTRFDMPLQRMKELDKADHNCSWALKNTEAVLYVESFDINSHAEDHGGDVKGILFIK